MAGFGCPPGDIDLDQYLGAANAKILVSDSAIVESEVALDSFCYKGVAERQKQPGEFNFQGISQDWETCSFGKQP